MGHTRRVDAKVRKAALDRPGADRSAIAQRVISLGFALGRYQDIVDHARTCRWPTRLRMNQRGKARQFDPN